MKNWLKKCSVALLVFSMIGTTMPVYAADAPAAKTQTTTENHSSRNKLRKNNNQLMKMLKGNRMFRSRKRQSRKRQNRKPNQKKAA